MLHPAAAGRVYAAYSGVYIGTAICVWLVEGVTPTVCDIVGSGVTLVGIGIIMFSNKTT